MQAGGIKTARCGMTFKGGFQGIESTGGFDGHTLLTLLSVICIPEDVQPTSLMWLVAGRKEVFSCLETSAGYVVWHLVTSVNLVQRLDAHEHSQNVPYT